MTLARIREAPLSELGAQPRCDVAGRLIERAQAGAHHSGGGRVHNVGQITWRLSNLNIVHQSAKFASNSVTNW